MHEKVINHSRQWKCQMNGWSLWVGMTGKGGMERVRPEGWKSHFQSPSLGDLPWPWYWRCWPHSCHWSPCLLYHPCPSLPRHPCLLHTQGEVSFLFALGLCLPIRMRKQAPGGRDSCPSGSLGVLNVLTSAQLQTPGLQEWVCACSHVCVCVLNEYSGPLPFAFLGCAVMVVLFL